MSVLQVGGFEAGLALYMSGEFSEAVDLLTQLVDKEPDHAEGHHVLALSLRTLNRPRDAAHHLAETVRLQPANAEALSNYGAVLRECGELESAAQVLTKAMEADANNSNAWNNFATVLLDLGKVSEADEALSTSLQLQPENAEALANRSRAQYELGNMRSAWRLARSSIALNPNLAEAHNRLSFVQASCGDLEDSLRSLETAVRLDPTSDLNQSNLLLRSLGSDKLTASDLHDSVIKWGNRYSENQPECLAKAVQIKRIGFVSGDFRHHPVGLFLLSLLRELKAEVEIVCYTTHQKADSVTLQIQETSTLWRNICSWDAGDAAQLIQQDQIDVLVDLAGHTGNNRLDMFARRPAPIQVSWLGYSWSTGLPQMDAILADQVLIPEEHKGHYTERILHLPASFLCFEPGRPRSPDKLPTATFGVFNNPAKFSESTYTTWAEILTRTPGSTLLIKYHNLHDPWAQEKIAGRFEDLGIDTDRLSFSSTLDYQDHLDSVSNVSVALDTFPYTGATTTLDCLSAGTPVVTLAGDRYAARMSASLLNAIGRQDWVCESKEDYVNLAVKLASEKHDRAALRQSLYDSPLCDCQRFAKDFMATLIQLL